MPVYELSVIHAPIGDELHNSSLLVGAVGLEPTRLATPGLKSSASANSATPPWLTVT